MGSHARQSIDTSIVSQSKVQLIHCQCKSRLQISNLGINNAFLAATKQLYEWYFPSVRLSVCPSHLFDYVPIIVSSWNSQELSPRTRVTSMQKIKVRGQRSRSQVTTQLNRFRTVTSQGHDGFPSNSFRTMYRPNKHRPFWITWAAMWPSLPHNNKCWLISRSNYL